MKTTELRLKLEKAEEKLAKALSTIEKRNVKIQNMKEKMEMLGYSTEPDARFEPYSDGMMMSMDYGRLIEDNVWGSKKLPELERIVEGWKTKLEKAMIEENKFAELPEALKTMEAYLIQKWFDYEIQRREAVEEDIKNLPYAELSKKYNGRHFEYTITDEEILKNVEREARYWVMDLAYRVADYVGTVTDWKGIRFDGKALNGLVVGTEGTANLETIVAGGYNIQKLHYRVLVKKWKA